MNKLALLLSLCLSNASVYAEESKNSSERTTTKSQLEAALYACFKHNFNSQECEKNVFKFAQRNLSRPEIKQGALVFKDIYNNECSTLEDKKNYECTLTRDMYKILQEKYKSTRSS